MWQILAGLTLIVLEGIADFSAGRFAAPAPDTARAERRARPAGGRVAQRTLELMVANTKLEQQATTDPLTGIGNRRRMTEQINKELERSRASSIRCRC
jgi:PleD family two-component response regulator